MADRHDRHDEQAELESRRLGYEVRDVNAWAISRFAISLVLLCIFAVALLFGLFRYFESTYGGPMPTIALDDARSLPPAPTLERTPVLNLERFRAAEDQVLNSYSWIDRQRGIVHVPINVAIDLLAKQGLPSRQQAPAVDKADTPTESGLGPIMQQPGGPLAPELNASAPVAAAPQTPAPQGAAHTAEKP